MAEISKPTVELKEKEKLIHIVYLDESLDKLSVESFQDIHQAAQFISRHGSTDNMRVFHGTQIPFSSHGLINVVLGDDTFTF